MTAARSASEQFPERLRAARELRDLNQAELAERAGFHPPAISRFERGDSKPSFENLRKLAKALEVSTDYLLGIVDDPKGVAEKNDELFRDFDKLSADDRDFARKFVSDLAKRRK